MGAVVSRGLASTGFVAAFGLVTGCRAPTEPELVSADPSVVVQGEEVTVRLSGRHLLNSSRVDLDSRRAAVTSKAWSVEIGDLRIGPGDVELLDPQTLVVVVPGTLRLGEYDVAVTTATGAHPTLRRGLTVVGRGDALTSGSLSTAPVSASDTDGSVAATGTATEDTSTHVAASATVISSAEVRADAGSAGGESSQLGGTGSRALLDAAASEAGETNGMDAGQAAATEGSSSFGASAVDAGGDSLDALRGALVHRYSFEAVGSTVLDEVSGADGTFIGAVLDGSGAATFTGGGEYVDLPNGLISGRDAVTVEVWLTWDVPNSGEAYRWQRIFDFGSNSALEGEQGAQDTHLFLSPRSGGPAGALHLAYRGDLTGSVTLNAQSPLTPGIVEHVAAVVDGTAGRMQLYLDGGVVATRDWGFELSLIDDENNWLGRSQVLGDPAFQGRIFELRIYDGALSAESLRESHTAGPDAAL